MVLQVCAERIGNIGCIKKKGGAMEKVAGY